VTSCPNVQTGTAFTWTKPTGQACISQGMHTFLSFYVLRKFMTVATTARHWSSRILQNWIHSSEMLQTRRFTLNKQYLTSRLPADAVCKQGDPRSEENRGQTPSPSPREIRVQATLWATVEGVEGGAQNRSALLLNPHSILHSLICSRPHCHLRVTIVTTLASD